MFCLKSLSCHRGNKVFNGYKSLHSMIQLQKSKVVLRDEEIYMILYMYLYCTVQVHCTLYWTLLQFTVSDDKAVSVHLILPRDNAMIIW